ncbi:MAG TPA: cation:proton antiporter, partial [Steroidobacteraceae bacterium]|nr:cation:proton antiporter [Steroidobacteraceae bacterium]
AAATHYVLGLPWPVGFVLGAIISPPDAVAPLAIARRMCLPRRILVILEGEGLANDATALVLYRFAVIAVTAHSVSIGRATGTFGVIVAGELLWGIGVGWLMLRLRHWARDTHIEITLSLLTPFLAYWPPQHLGGSGVLATVTAGLYTSWNGPRLISSATRLQGVFFWDFLTYTVEGLVFLVTGLQTREVIAEIAGFSARDLLLAAGVVSAVMIAARFLWIFPAGYVSARLRAGGRAEQSWQRAFTVAFTGIRGVVSLAAALALPLTTEDGHDFPRRSLILFLTYAVILVTLVGQGLTLPAVIRWLGLAHAGRRERHAEHDEELRARHAAIEAALERLQQLATQRNLDADVVQSLKGLYRERLRRVEQRDDEVHHERIRARDALELDLIAAERERVNALHRDGHLTAESRRRVEHGFDLREAHLASVGSEE